MQCPGSAPAVYERSVALYGWSLLTDYAVHESSGEWR